MGGRFKIYMAVVLIVLTGVLVVFLVFLLREGLPEASMWATFLVLPLTVVTTIAGVWATVLASRTLRNDHEQNDRRSSVEERGAMPGVTRSGDVRQEHTGGPAIAPTIRRRQQTGPGTRGRDSKYVG